MRRLLFIIPCLILAACVSLPDPGTDGTTAMFERMGSLTINNPGQTPDTWHLVYEEPGKPALSVELRFDVMSDCIIGAGRGICDGSALSSGMRVRVKGDLVEGLDAVRVRELRTVR